MSALTLIKNGSAVSPNLTLPTSGAGGVGPYTYAVLGGGAGGSINSSGLYTAPNATGIDTIQVTDSTTPTPLTATGNVLIGNALELLCDILQTSLGLSQGQVYLWDQKIGLGTDYKLYVVVGVLFCKPFANSNEKTREDGSVFSKEGSWGTDGTIIGSGSGSGAGDATTGVSFFRRAS